MKKSNSEWVAYFIPFAQAGKQFLLTQDQTYFDGIDLDDLDLSNPCGCVLGQKFEHYEDGLAALKLDYDQAVAYGFNLPEELPVECYPHLTQAWEIVLEEPNKF